MLWNFFSQFFSFLLIFWPFFKDMLYNALGLGMRFVQLSGVLMQKMGWDQRLIYQAFALCPKNACLIPCLLVFWCWTLNVIVRRSPPHLDTHTSISKTHSKLKLFICSYAPAPLAFFVRMGLVPARSCLPKTLSHLIPAQLACTTCVERTSPSLHQQHPQRLSFTVLCAPPFPDGHHHLTLPWFVHFSVCPSKNISSMTSGTFSTVITITLWTLCGTQ